MIYPKNYLNARIYLFISFFILFQQNRSIAQIVIEEEPNRLYYDFTTKRITNPKEWKNFRDVFHKDKYWMGKNRISGTIAYNTGRVLVTPPNSFESTEEWRQAISFSTRIRFWEQFSVNTNFFVDFNKKASARWISDYSYTIGRYHWKPNKFNYGYENYINNKYSDDLSTFCEKFLEGYYFLSYSHNLPPRATDAISLDESTNLKFVYFVRYAIKYRDELNFTHGGIINGKSTLGFALRYTIYKNIYIEGGVYYYPEKFKRQAWDPDFTYGFGYFDWRSFRISITYGNWAINRFPGQENPYPKYGFLDGQFRVVANWIW